MLFLRSAVGLVAQTTPNPASWATYGPLGLIVGTLLTFMVAIVWFFIRREAARNDRLEQLLWKALEANKEGSASHAEVQSTIRRALDDRYERGWEREALEALISEVVDRHRGRKT